MKAISRSYTYWPNIDPDIVDLVRIGEPFALAAKSLVKCELCTFWALGTHPHKLCRIYELPIFYNRC